MQSRRELWVGSSLNSSVLVQHKTHLRPVNQKWIAIQPEMWGDWRRNTPSKSHPAFACAKALNTAKVLPATATWGRFSVTHTAICAQRGIGDGHEQPRSAWQGTKTGIGKTTHLEDQNVETMEAGHFRKTPRVLARGKGGDPDSQNDRWVC